MNDCNVSKCHKRHSEVGAIQKDMTDHNDYDYFSGIIIIIIIRKHPHNRVYGTHHRIFTSQL